MALYTSKREMQPKKVTLETFAIKLMDKLMQAESPAVVERYIAVAVRALGSKKVNGYIIQRFIDRVTRYLDSHTPCNAQQAENSRIARAHLQQFRQAISAPEQ